MLEYHPYACQFPLPEGDDLERLKESVASTKGIAEDPVKYRVCGGKKQGIDGRCREHVCELLGIKPTYQQVRLKDDEVEAYIDRRNLARRHQNAEDRRKLVLAWRAAGESVRTIAGKLGVDPRTVRRDLEEAGDSGGANAPPEKVTGKDGRSYPATRPKTRAERVGQAEPLPPVLKNGYDKPESPPKNGSVFDWNQAESLYGEMVRATERVKKQVAALGGAYHVEASSAEAHTCRAALADLEKLQEQFKRTWDDWRRRLQKGRK